LSLALVAALGACGPGAERGTAGGDDAPVLIYAAASLAPVLEDCFAGDARVIISAASSSTVAKQIDAGAPADVFLSADPGWVEWLEERGRLEPESRFDFARNRLVVVGAIDSAFGWDPAVPASFPAAFQGRLAIGDPEHVPAGIYARDALRHAGIWDALSGRVLGAVDARAACVLVERGECDAGIVYASDAHGSARVRIVGEIPQTWHTPIVYVGAVCAGRMRPTTRRVVDALQSPRMAGVLRERGFPDPEGAAWIP
jgi:molybdate transport system substrate-binding protein